MGEVLQNLRALSLVQPGQHIDFKVDLLSSLHVVCAAERSSALHTCRDKAREDFDSLRDCIPLYSSRCEVLCCPLCIAHAELTAAPAGTFPRRQRRGAGLHRLT